MTFDERLTRNARRVLSARYLQPAESPDQMIDRVARAVSLAEKSKPRQEKWFQKFSLLLRTGRFLPNSPTLMNAGKPEGQLSACYVLPLQPDLDSVFGTLKEAAKIHQSGGGTGFSFSRIPTDVLSFIKIYDATTEAIKQSGVRRGANMAILDIDHPEVFEFIDAKRDYKTLLNFNLSVAVTDAFFRDLESGKKRAEELFDRIVDAAWTCGDPGLVFLDRMNFFNPTPSLGRFECTNPCGEQPLLAHESCNLGSLNLNEYAHAGSFDWEQYSEDIAVAVRFLDNVIDVNHFPTKNSDIITRKNRKIGLGVMGFADVVLKLKIPYGSEAAVRFGEQIMSVLDRIAKKASMELAKEKGAFSGFSSSLWNRLGYPKLRNATVSTVAPTGTISLIAGCSSGIEPIFSGVFTRNVLSGEKLSEIHPVVEEILGKEAATFDDEALREKLGEAWVPAARVSIEQHIRIQAAFQRHSDSSVSKTINLPEQATREDVKRAYLLAYRLGCKGITVYRDQSRPTQVLVRTQEYCPNC